MLYDVAVLKAIWERYAEKEPTLPASSQLSGPVRIIRLSRRMMLGILVQWNAVLAALAGFESLLLLWGDPYWHSRHMPPSPLIAK